MIAVLRSRERILRTRSIVVGSLWDRHLLVLYRVKYKFDDDDSAHSLRGLRRCGGSARRQRLDGILNSCGPRFTCAGVVSIIFIISTRVKNCAGQARRNATLFFSLSTILAFDIRYEDVLFSALMTLGSSATKRILRWMHRRTRHEIKKFSERILRRFFRLGCNFTQSYYVRSSCDVDTF